jgi:hypothetical protein
MKSLVAEHPKVYSLYYKAKRDGVLDFSNLE